MSTCTISLHVSENVIHEGLEDRRTVGKAERYKAVLVVPSRGWECCFPLIALPDSNQVLCWAKIELGKIFGFGLKYSALGRCTTGNKFNGTITWTMRRKFCSLYLAECLEKISILGREVDHFWVPLSESDSADRDRYAVAETLFVTGRPPLLDLTLLPWYVGVVFA